MNGIWRSEFNKVVEKAIQTYAEKYHQLTTDVSIGIVFAADAKTITYHTLVGNKLKETVRLVEILHGPGSKLDFTGKSLIIPGFLSKALTRLSAQYGIARERVKVLFKWDEGQIYSFLMNGPALDRILGDEDFLTDDQVAIDQMEES